MLSYFDDVGDFHAKFDLPVTNSTRRATMPSIEVLEYRLKFLREELEEIQDAVDKWNLASFFDGLIDLAWVAMGTAHYAGLPWQEGWTRVVAANLAKVRASELPSDTPHKRGSAEVIRKPPGWEPPNLVGVIAEHNNRAKFYTTMGKIAHSVTTKEEVAQLAEKNLRLERLSAAVPTVHAPRVEVSDDVYWCSGSSGGSGGNSSVYASSDSSAPLQPRRLTDEEFVREVAAEAQRRVERLAITSQPLSPVVRALAIMAIAVANPEKLPTPATPEAQR